MIESPPTVSVPFEYRGNHIYLPVRIGASRPLAFILETGAGMTVVDEATAEELALGSGGSRAAAGAGEDRSTVRTCSVSDLRVGSVVVPRMEVARHSFERIQAHAGRSFDGLLGYDVLCEFVVEIDYRARRATLHRPDAFHYVGSGETIPFRLELNLILVPGRIVQPGREPLHGEFVIDTGAGGQSALVLTAPFVRNHDLPGSGQRTIDLDAAGHGIGGATAARVGRVGELVLGSLSVRRPITLFSNDQRGFLSWPGRAGVIGNEILRRSRLFIDYPRQQIILEKNSDWDEPYDYDMSGITLIAEGAGLDRFRVVRVLGGSPASDAGIRPGDRLLRLDGHSSTLFGLARLRTLFLHDRRRHILSIERGGEVIDVQLETRRMV